MQYGHIDCVDDDNDDDYYYYYYCNFDDDGDNACDDDDDDDDDDDISYVLHYLMLHRRINSNTNMFLISQMIHTS